MMSCRSRIALQNLLHPAGDGEVPLADDCGSSNRLFEASGSTAG